MSINLRSILADPSAVKKRGFTGAIFTTFTLDLGFFEQLIIPKLDEAGCSNLMIFADPDGYQSALDMRGTGVWGVGQNYLCIPVNRPGGGVQHAKLALLVGPHHGRLLLGSGNLTMHGYGRNLELYSHFEYAHDESPDVQRYPFTNVWQFLQRLANDERLTLFAKQQLDTIQHSAPWLDDSVELPRDFRVWHNYERPIWDQLMEWRGENGFLASPAGLVQVISPFYDQDGRALATLALNLKTNHIDLHLHRSSTNFNGKTVSEAWKEQASTLALNELHAKSVHNKGLVRNLHAKAIIAKEKEGVWCISGSSNMTIPGLLRPWLHGGNLEMVTFQWSANPAAFDYLLSDPVLQISPLVIEDVKVTESEPSERISQSIFAIIIKDAVVRGRLLEGKLSNLPSDCPHSGTLSFLRLNIQLPVELNGVGFTVQLTEYLKEADAVQLTLGSYITPFRWLDHPDLLLKHGARSYHGRVRSQLETIDGTEKLFIELMNYLWQRIDITKVSVDDRQKRAAHSRNNVTPPASAIEPDETLTPDRFIIPESEVASQLSRHIDSQLPYDQSLLGLQDLLSIALLRLTIPVASSEVAENPEEKPKGNPQEAELVEVRKVKALERLRIFLLDYCKHFGQRLVNPEFVATVGGALLFENHTTLSRVLLNFASTVDEFSQADLARCILRIWAPLVLPKMVGLEGRPTLEMLTGPDDLRLVWDNSGMASHTIAAFVTSFGNPPQWQSGLWDDKGVQKYVAVRDILNKIELLVGERAFSTNLDELQDAYGIQSLAQLESPTKIHDQRMELVVKQFEALKKYRPPLEEKYSEFLELQTLRKNGLLTSPRAIELQHRITLKGYQKELQLFVENKLPILPVMGDDGYCPRCGGGLPKRLVSDLKSGSLVLCSASCDALIYRIPGMERTIFT